jgi:hypothetical protein
VAFLVTATGVDLVTTISSVMACIGNAVIRSDQGRGVASEKRFASCR